MDSGRSTRWGGAAGACRTACSTRFCSRWGRRWRRRCACTAPAATRCRFRASSHSSNILHKTSLPWSKIFNVCFSSFYLCSLRDNMDRWTWSLGGRSHPSLDSALAGIGSGGSVTQFFNSNIRNLTFIFGNFASFLTFININNHMYKHTILKLQKIKLKSYNKIFWLYIVVNIYI